MAIYKNKLPVPAGGGTFLFRQESTQRGGPVAVPGIFVSFKKLSSSADRSHSLRSLFPPPAALPSLPLPGPHPARIFVRERKISVRKRRIGKGTL